MKEIDVEKVAVYPGSFDPITLGHIDIIERALKVFDKVIVLVMENFRKKHLFKKEERVNLIKKSLSNYDNVFVDSYDGLLVDYVRSNGIKFIVKGLRAISDFEYEFQQNMVNSSLCDVETIFFMTKSAYNFLSSSLVKEIAFFGGDISPFVHPSIIKDIQIKMIKFKEEESKVWN